MLNTQNSQISVWQWIWISLLGFSATLMGAYIAHAVTGLESIQIQSLKTAVLYHQLYSVLLVFWLLLSMLTSRRWLWLFGCWSLGLLLFSGSIYGLVLMSWGWMWPITPIGGTLLMLGWLSLAIEGSLYLKRASST